MNCEQIKTPRIYEYPNIHTYFKVKFHKDFEKIYQEVYEWYIQFKRISSKSEEEKVKAFVVLTCYCYPEGIFKRMVLISKTMIILIEVDDLIEDGNMEDGTFFESLMNHGNEINDVIEMLDKSTEHDYSPHVMQFSEIWLELKSLSNKEWQRRFAENYIWYMKSTKWEHKNNASKRVPSLIEYVEYRYLTGGCGILLDLIEMSEDNIIPEYIHANVTFHRLNFITCLVTYLLDDIFSFEKEKAEGKIHNLVIVMKSEFNISDQEAIEKAVKFVNDELEKFIVVEQLLPAFEGDMNERVKKYVEACKSSICGTYEWGCKTGRYVLSNVQ